MQEIQEGMRIADNVLITLTDAVTGATRSFSSHNIALNYAFSAFAQWIAGVNNQGQNAVFAPSVVALGSGTGTPAVTDTGLFAAIAGATASLSYVQPNSPAAGTTTFVFQIAAGVVTVQVTEALMSDRNGSPWFHTNFPTPFTPAGTESVTIQWQTTFAA